MPPPDVRPRRLLHRPRLAAALLFAAVVGTMGGCDAFAPRVPEAPGAGGGVFVQPDTPEQVVETLRRAIAARDADAYRRSLAPGFRFTATPDAEARTPLFATWDASAEDAAFRALVAAATPGTAFSLRLADALPPEVSERAYVLDATYVLSTPHRRPEAPTSVQGRLRWTVERQPNGLWALAEWTDRSLDTATPTWSDLKAAFAR